MSTTVRFKGKEIDLGGMTYVVPPLALGTVKELLPRIQKIKSSGIPSAEDIDTMVDVLLSAIRRNYPDVTAETLLEVVDIGNVGSLFSSVLGISGLVKVEDVSGNSEAGAASP